MDKYSINAVLAATDDINSKNSSNNNSAIAELFSQSNATLKNRIKYAGKISKFENKIFCFCSEKKSIANIKCKLTIPGSILYIVGHHENYGKNGPSGANGFTPEELADNSLMK